MLDWFVIAFIQMNPWIFLLLAMWFILESDKHQGSKNWVVKGDNGGTIVVKESKYIGATLYANRAP